MLDLLGCEVINRTRIEMQSRPTAGLSAPIRMNIGSREQGAVNGSATCNPGFVPITSSRMCHPTGASTATNGGSQIRLNAVSMLFSKLCLQASGLLCNVWGSIGQDVGSRLACKRQSQIGGIGDDGLFAAVLNEIDTGFDLGLHASRREMSLFHVLPGFRNRDGVQPGLIGLVEIDGDLGHLWLYGYAGGRLL